MIKKISDGIGKVENIIGGVALVLMVLESVYAIIMRFVLKLPNTWGEEVCRYMFVIAVFFGICITIRERKQMGVTMFVDMLHGKAKKAVTLIQEIITAFTYAWIAYISISYTIRVSGQNQISVATGIPMWIMYLLMSIALVLAAFRCILLLWNDYISKTHPLGTIGEEA